MQIIKKISMDDVVIFAGENYDHNCSPYKSIDGDLSTNNFGDIFSAEKSEELFVQTVFNSPRIIKQIKIISNINSVRIVGCEHPYKCKPIQTIKELNSDNKTINVILLDNNTKYMAYLLDQINSNEQYIQLTEMEFFE